MITDLSVLVMQDSNKKDDDADNMAKIMDHGYRDPTATKMMSAAGGGSRLGIPTTTGGRVGDEGDKGQDNE